MNKKSEIQKVNEIIDGALKETMPLNEMSMAWNSKQNNRCVWVENPSGQNNKYFKYLDGITYGKANRCARISMLESKYVEHRDYGGKSNWVLNTKERKELVTLMNQQNKKYSGCTNWQATLITYNEDNFGIDFDETIDGTFDREKFPDAFDINTPMPNYMTLKLVDKKSETQDVNEAIHNILREGYIPLNEMSMAWVDKVANKCVWVENPNPHTNDYFKYYNSFSYHKADGVARISLREPKYLEHKNLDGKTNWKLNTKEKKELVRLMNEPSKVRSGFTNWQVTLIQYNFDNFYIQPEETINGTIDRNEFPGAFSIDYPMPNYMELK